MWVATTAHWLTNWTIPKRVKLVVPVVFVNRIPIYKFVPLELNLAQRVLARPPPELAYVL